MSNLPEGPRVGEVIIRYKTGGGDISNLPTGGGGGGGDPFWVSADNIKHYYTKAEAESGALPYHFAVADCRPLGIRRPGAWFTRNFSHEPTLPRVSPKLAISWLFTANNNLGDTR